MSDHKNPLDELASKVQQYKTTGASDAVMTPLEQFADKLIDQKGFPSLTPEVRGELRKDILLRLDDFIAARSIAALSDENVMIFERLLQEGKAESQIQQFLADHIDNYQDFVTNVLLEFQDVYVGTLMPPYTDEEVQTQAAVDMDMPPPPPPAPVKH
jgi:hypothetical protein